MEGGLKVILYNKMAPKKLLDETLFSQDHRWAIFIINMWG